jgi:putative chitinase
MPYRDSSFERKMGVTCYISDWYESGIPDTPIDVVKKKNPIEITSDQLMVAMPSLGKPLAQKVTPILNKTFIEFEINTVERRNMFLAQIAHESADMTKFVEDGSDSYFKKLYEDNENLGNTEPGDGVKFKGRGAIQITGRWNYGYVGTTLKLGKNYFLDKPEELETNMEYAIRASGAFWKLKKLNSLIDSKASLKTISIKINGKNKKTGLPNGLEDRKERLQFIDEVLKP